MEVCMKKIQFSTLLIIFVFFQLIISSFAEETIDKRETDHQALRDLKSNVIEAINNQDMAKLITYFSKDFVFTSVTQEALTSEKAVKDYYNKMMKGDKALVNSINVAAEADILTRFLGDNAGYCYGTADETYVLNKSNRTVTMKTRWTAVVIKEDNQWKIVAVHIGANVMDNPILEASSMSLWRKLTLGLGIGKYPGEK